MSSQTEEECLSYGSSESQEEEAPMPATPAQQQYRQRLVAMLRAQEAVTPRSADSAAAYEALTPEEKRTLWATDEGMQGGTDLLEFVEAAATVVVQNIRRYRVQLNEAFLYDAANVAADPEAAMPDAPAAAGEQEQEEVAGNAAAVEAAVPAEEVQEAAPVEAAQAAAAINGVPAAPAAAQAEAEDVPAVIAVAGPVAAAVVAAEAAPVAAAEPAAREAALPAAAEGEAVQVPYRAGARAADGRDMRDRRHGERELTGVWARIEPGARPPQVAPAPLDTPAPRRPNAARAGTHRYAAGASLSSSSSGQRQMSDPGQRERYTDKQSSPSRRHGEQDTGGQRSSRDGERRGFGAAVLSGDFGRRMSSSRGEQGRNHAAAAADRDRERSFSPHDRPVGRDTGRYRAAAAAEDPPRWPHEGFTWRGAVAQRDHALLPSNNRIRWHAIGDCLQEGGCVVCHMVREYNRRGR